MPTEGIEQLRHLSEEMGHNSWRLPKAKKKDSVMDWVSIESSLRAASVSAGQQDMTSLVENLEKLAKFLDA